MSEEATVKVSYILDNLNLRYITQFPHQGYVVNFVVCENKRKLALMIDTWKWGKRGHSDIDHHNRLTTFHKDNWDVLYLPEGDLSQEEADLLKDEIRESLHGKRWLVQDG